MSLIAIDHAQLAPSVARRVGSQMARLLNRLRGLLMLDDSAIVIRSGLLDSSWYRKIAGCPGLDPAGLAWHYLETGYREGLDPNRLFDNDWYLDRYRSEIGDEVPLLHYLSKGWKGGLDPHPLFSVDFYLSTNPDVRRAGCEPLGHFLEYGFREGRSPSKDFDVAYYVESNPDVAEAGINPLLHFIEYGAAEGRYPKPRAATPFTGSAARRSAPPLRQSGLPKCAERDGVIAMDASFSVSHEDYQRWLGAFESRQSQARRALPRPVISIMRCDLRGERIWRDGLPEITDPSPDQGCGRHFVLVCDETDEIDADLLDGAVDQIGNKRDLAVFDFVVASTCGSRWHPRLLPGPNHTLIGAVDATSSRFIIAVDLMQSLAVLKPGCPYDMLRSAISHLRETDSLTRFAHVPIPLLRARGSSPAKAVPAADREGGRRNHARSTLKTPPAADRRDVSVVICTKDRCLLLSQLLDSLLQQSSAILREILVITNAEADSYARSVHRRFKNEKRVTFMDHEGPYNFSIQSNYGARHATGSHLLFLNDDIVTIDTAWLGELLAPFEHPGIGVTGPLLLYPDERAQHAGMYLGYNGCAGHARRGARYPIDEYCHTLTAPRNVSLVTGAALLTARDLFQSLNGFDRQLGTFLQDVDYCLRVRNSGRDIVYHPAARLFHMESVSMNDSLGTSSFDERRALEHKHFRRRWGEALGGDRFHNPNLDVADETWKTITLKAA